MQEANALLISNQLGKIVIELAAIREALEKLTTQQDHTANNMTKRY